jgi:PPOX class probable F420-dependent enzyme
MALDEDVARLAKSRNLATVVTLMPDGRPQAQLTWVDHDGEHVLVNTEPVRQRSRNLRRDPRVTVLIHSGQDPWDWAEIRAHIDELAQRYTGSDYGRPVGPDGRIILVIEPDKINTPRSLGRR